MASVGTLNDYVAGTTIVSADVEADFAALKAGVNAAVFTDEATTVTVTHDWNAVQDFAGGAVGAPGIYLAGETTTGLYRIGANNHGYSVSGAKVLDISSTGLAVTGTLTVSSGPNAVGGATADYVHTLVTGSFTSGGASTLATGLQVGVTLTGHSGDSGTLAQFRTAGAITMTGNATLVTSAYFDEPDITTGGNTATVGATVYIENAPSEGSTNWALWVDGGNVQFDGNLNVDGTATIGTLALAQMIVDQGAADTASVLLRSDDITTGLTTGVPITVTTNDYFAIAKSSATIGGAVLQATAEDGALTTVLGLNAHGGTADTTKTTAGVGLVNMIVTEQDAMASQANVTADGNVFSVQARVGGSTVTRFMVDEDGDLYSVTAAQTFDEHDDLALVDSYDMIRSGFAEFASENEAKLIELGILGAPISEGGMTNMTQLQRLLTGAVRQLAKDYGARLEALETKVLHA